MVTLNFKKSKAETPEHWRVNFNKYQFPMKFTIFNSADFHASSGQSTNGSLTTWSGSLLLGTASCTDFDVKRGHAELFASHCDVLCGLHGSVRRVFVAISFDFHATGYARDRF